MIITLDELYRIIPKREVARILKRESPNLPDDDTIYREAAKIAELQESMIEEYLGKIFDKEQLSETVRWCICAKTAWAIAFQSDLSAMKEKYGDLYKITEAKLKQYKDGTISRNETTGTVRISKRRRNQTFLFG